MTNDSDLRAELRRHNLLLPFMRQQIIAEAVQEENPSTKDLEQARAAYFEANNVIDDETLNRFLQNKGICQQDLEWQIALPLRIKSHCEKNYLAKAEARFLQRKNQLDQVVYSLLRTKDSMLARELYLRIEANEANFGDLAETCSEGPERKSKGIVGPVSLTQAHPILAEVLRTAKPGELKHPFQLGDWWLVLRLESYTPATFDDSMALRMGQELFDEWIQQELGRRMAAMNEQGVATNAE